MSFFYNYLMVLGYSKHLIFLIEFNVNYIRLVPGFSISIQFFSLIILYFIIAVHPTTVSTTLNLIISFIYLYLSWVLFINCNYRTIIKLAFFVSSSFLIILEEVVIINFHIFIGILFPITFPVLLHQLPWRIFW